MSLTTSVVIPVFNGAATIGHALSSIINQTRPPQEVIVVNDRSTDTTEEVVARIATSSPMPIRLINNEQNLGPGLSRNAGWAQATGDLIAFLDADDAWHPQKLEIQIPAMENDPQLVMSCHDRTVGLQPHWAHINSATVTWRSYEFRDFITRNRCATPSVMVRRNLTERFSPDLRYSEDYFLWLTITHRHGAIRFATHPLVHCTNPAYGGRGLSGNLWLMFRGEARAMRLLRQSKSLSLLQYGGVLFWITSKFVVRIVDHLLLRGRIQTVSESR